MIKIPNKVYKKFLKFALENANPLSHSNWRECIGLVLGYFSGDDVEVTDIIPIGAGSSVFVDINNYEKVFSLIPPTKFESGEFIVGWAHTHPGLGLFFSGTDISTQTLYQKMHPKSFGLVLDPTKITETFPGFKIFRVSEKTSNYYPVEYKIDIEEDFTSIKEELTKELFILVTTEKEPRLIAKNVAIWNKIQVSIISPKRIQKNRLFSLSLTIATPFTQYIRLQYSVKLDNKVKWVIPYDDYSLDPIINETLTSGSLVIISLKSLEAGTATILFENLYISDYNQELIRLPDLLCSINILE
ncbi:MAG: Mov34/MPN/PAD-1 family protein [Candidatus Hodarchaeales archaeon]